MKRWVMKKERIVKKDGRYLIYYRFKKRKLSRRGVKAKDV